MRTNKVNYSLIKNINFCRLRNSTTQNNFAVSKYLPMQYLDTFESKNGTTNKTNPNSCSNNNVDLNNVHSFILPNNAQIILEANDRHRKVVAKLILLGAKNIKSKPHTKEVLTEMMRYRSAEMSSDITNKKSMFYYDEANSIKSSLVTKDATCTEAFTVFFSALFNPIFTQDEFERAKKIIKENLNNSNSNLYENAYSEFFKKDVNSQELEALTLTDVQNYYNEFLNNSKAKMAVTMPENISKKFEQEVMQLMPNTMKFAQQNEPPYDQINNIPTSKTYTAKAADGISSYKKIFALSGVNSTKDRLLVQIVQKLYEKNYQNQKYIFLATKNDYGNGNFVLEFGAIPKKEYSVFHQFYSDSSISQELKTQTNNKICQLSDRPISVKDLQATKNEIKNERMDSIEDQVLRTDILLNEYNGSDIQKTFFEGLNKITSQDVQKAVRHYVSTNFIEVIEE